MTSYVTWCAPLTLIWKMGITSLISHIEQSNKYLRPYIKVSLFNNHNILCLHWLCYICEYKFMSNKWIFLELFQLKLIFQFFIFHVSSFYTQNLCPTKKIEIVLLSHRRSETIFWSENWKKNSLENLQFFWGFKFHSPSRICANTQHLQMTLSSVNHNLNLNFGGYISKIYSYRA